MATQEVQNPESESLSVASRFVETPDAELLDLLYPTKGPAGRCVARTILSLVSVDDKLDLEKAKELARWVSIQNYNSSLSIVDLFLALEEEGKLEGKYLSKMFNPSECSIEKLRSIVDSPDMQACILIELHDEASGVVEQHLAHIDSIQIDDSGVITSIKSRSDRGLIEKYILEALNKKTSFSLFVLSQI